MYDVTIIGAGVVGSAIARELSKYNLKTCLIEKEDDVTTGASKANSGIVHGGYSAKYGTLKGELCAKGNAMYKELEEQLHFGYKKTGALIIGFNEEDEKRIKALYDNGIKIGCDDLEIIYNDKIREIEPHINEKVYVALYAKSVGVTSPYEFTIALAENAIKNGVELKLETLVKSIEKKEDKFIIKTNKEDIESRYIINAAGVYSDKVANMVGIYDFEILPRRGQYILLGKDQGKLINTVIFQVPTEKGKGILVTTTYHGNLMIGPNAEEVDDKMDVATDIETLNKVLDTARMSIPDFDVKKALTTFSGIRAISSTGDFIIEESKVKGFINVAGIDSPGLTSSPAIAKKVSDILKESGLVLNENKSFDAYRKPIFKSKDIDNDLGLKIDDKNPNKNIICRCETVTESEIVDALHRGIPIKSTDAIKRRTRAGMGTCQGNFCKGRVKAIIARELDLPVENITVRGDTSTDRLQRVNINLVRKLK
ncbi:FAD/[2Fe-2S]-binding family oxidoreductase [Clostridium putrefaciens]|uniref:FAD/[2Fe-2S]-binding family oxidoreductase n=1 Tax=Clostridium putrefaciens TaxID=99675 RepID=A0A381J7I0_9CLOT|nr:NAD(P)/FAD-dependent oxidoreductase [Clostridium putrefaciens]SUY46228.1 FAD/[2Fe-2S]-binding family oxidoreductase [Clostridium putrefaciens]